MENTKQKTRRVTKHDAEIGFRIRKLRQDKKISQQVIADKIGITYQQLQKYELGRNRISGPRLLQIADALEVEVGELLNPACDIKLSPVIQYRALPNIDETAARLWRRIKCERHKYAVIELMDILRHQPQIQPQDTKQMREHPSAVSKNRPQA